MRVTSPIRELVSVVSLAGERRQIKPLDIADESIARVTGRDILPRVFPELSPFVCVSCEADDRRCKGFRGPRLDEQSGHAVLNQVLAGRVDAIGELRDGTFASGAAMCEGRLIEWAHQDSNLERAGYEPAALTVELWAHNKL